MNADERKAHMARLGATGNANRLVLSADEVAALGQAYLLLAHIHSRHAEKLARATESEVDGDAMP